MVNKKNVSSFEGLNFSKKKQLFKDLVQSLSQSERSGEQTQELPDFFAFNDESKEVVDMVEH